MVQINDPLILVTKCRKIIFFVNNMTFYGLEVCLYSVRLGNLFEVSHLKQSKEMSAPTAEQIEMLLNFLEEHRELARGLLRNVEGRLQSQRLWDEICTSLNSMGGCTKTVQQWQRVWTDKKYLAKKNVAASRRSANATGGGPSTAPQLSRWDLRVMTIMGDGFGEPQTTARVPAFVEESLPPSQQPPSQQPLSSQMEPESQVIREYLVINESLQPSGTGSQPVLPVMPSQPVLPVMPATSNEHLPNEPTQRPSNTRRARRVRSTEDSVTRRFFSFEEQRLAQQAEWTNEFAGIRADLRELNNTLRELLTEMCAILREIVEQRR